MFVSLIWISFFLTFKNNKLVYLRTEIVMATRQQPMMLSLRGVKRRGNLM